MSRSRLNPFKNEIVQDYQNGVSYINIAKKYDCNPGTVYTFLKNCGVQAKKEKFTKYESIADKKEQVIMLYNQGFSAYKIGKQLHCNKNTTERYMKKLGLDLSRFDKNRKDELKNHSINIVQLYSSGLSTNKIAKQYKASQSSVWQLLEENNIQCRDKATHTLDETYFEKIDTVDKAYWLGWMYSDGSVCKTGKIRLSLQARDSEIVNQFKADVQYTGPLHYKPTPIKQPNKQPQWELCINRQKVVKDLIALGCEPNKTFTLKFPTKEQVPDEYLSDFLLGFFDGDGSILPKKTVMIVAPKEFFQGMIERLPFKIDFTYYVRHPDRNHNIVQFCINRRESVLMFLDYLYQNEKFCLKRKKDKYLLIRPLSK